MLNKKLIAGSIFALMSAPALAVPTFSAYTTLSVSQEGSATLAKVAVPAVTVTSGAEYSDDDLVVLSYNVALASTFVPASTRTMYAQCTDTDTTPAVIDGDANDNGGELTLGLLSSDAAAGTITYRITDVSYAVTKSSTTPGAGVCATSQNSSVGALLALEAVEVDGAAARAAGSVTASYHATLPNGTTDIDGGSIAMTHGSGTSKVSKLVNYTTQYTDVASTNEALYGVIDVTNAAPRSLFAASTTPSRSAGQVAEGKITLAKVGSLTSPTVDNNLTVTLNGDFSFLVDEDATTAGIQNNAFTAQLGTATAVVSDTITATSMSWTFGTTSVTLDDVTIAFNNGNNGDDGTIVATGAAKLAISEGTFTYDVSIAYKDGGLTGTSSSTNGVAGTSGLTSGGALGSWTLNGSSDVIANYPLSSAVTQFVWVTNTGTQDGGIFATAIGGTGAQTMATCDLGVTSKAGEIIRITDELNTCLTAAGMTAGRAQVTVTVNADGNLVDVYAGYKHNVDADRLNLTQ